MIWLCVVCLNNSIIIPEALDLPLVGPTRDTILKFMDGS